MTRSAPAGPVPTGAEPYPPPRPCPGKDGGRAKFTVVEPASGEPAGEALLRGIGAFEDEVVMGLLADEWALR
ncbi:hypothetical protein [Streptomyces sp. NPDC093514]|uniref:hypothetical protein n=1 Tax=Streptomyces sp. NPDC093514 TaxID=3366039 RepID=UPI0037F8138D